MPDEPKKPSPPEKPIAAIGLTAFRQELFGQPNASFSGREFPYIKSIACPSFQLDGDVETGFMIRLKIPRLIHFKFESFGECYAMFRTNDKVKPFQVSLSITASNMPTKVEGSVPFVISDSH